ncbi:PAS domain-containing sensor histidine kinase [Arthrobacter sp. 260]|uniref:sensor histidine kinase n=1 Tax=Arthrobacter sp. 260 TaxID=2735314 RepID=UPI001C10D4EA|nr:PAS domain-containing sensor histidine kinase [Arthrobacter sp. 260]
MHRLRPGDADIAPPEHTPFTAPTTSTSQQFWLLGDKVFERKLGLRGKTALFQLPLTLIIVLIAASAPFLNPEVFDNGAFLVGLGLLLLLFVACLLMPWERFPPEAILAIPLLDFIAIGFVRNGAYESLPGLGALSLFPVIWLAVSGRMVVVSALISFVAPYLIVHYPLLSTFSMTGLKAVETLLIPTAMLAVFLTMRLSSTRLMQQIVELDRKNQAVSVLEAESGNRERLLAAILDTVGVGVVAVDTEGRTLLSNRQQQLFLQAADQSDAKDEDVLPFSGSKGGAPLPGSMHPIRRAVNGECFSNNLLWLGEGDTQRAVSTAARPMIDTEGNFAGSVIVFNDVTELVGLLTVKEDFVANVTHEINTPLTSIVGHLDLVLESQEPLTPAAHQSLIVARRNAKRLSVLVSDLLSSTTQAMSLHPQPTELSELVASRVRSAKAQADVAGVNLVSELPDRLWVIADPLRIGQVVDNLLSNAIKYSPGGGDIVVRAHAGQDTVQIEVQDRGIGMTQREASLIYGRFFRARGAREAAIPGVGLGLAVTKAIVDGHGGTIRCASSPGVGTTFTVTLPRTIADTAAATSAEP